MCHVPRRNILSECTKEELAITEVVNMIEELGADVRLTNCVTKLNEVRKELSDFVDNIPSGC
jgi:hypothetical protein